MLLITSERPSDYFFDAAKNRPESPPGTRAAIGTRGLILFFLLALISACSSTTFFYNRLDLVLPWYLERYVDLDREQAQQVDAQLEILLDWHRREELPRYILLIERMEDALDAQLDSERLAALSADLEQAWNRIRDRGLDELLALGASLNEAQIEEFIAALNKRQRKYEKKYLERSEAEFRDDAYDNLRESLEDYLGGLDRAQREQVRRCAEELRRSDESWLRERAQWISTIEAELARAEGWRARVHALVVDWESQLDEDSLALYDHNAQRIQETIAAVLNLRSQRQDKRLRRELAGFREDFRVLSLQDS